MGRLSPDARGALYMLAGGVCMTLAHSTFKYVAADLPFGVIVLFRHIFGVLCFAPLILRRGRGLFRTRRLPGHFWRTLLGFCGYITFTYPLTVLSLGDTVALSFTAPFWSALIAVVVLREPVVPVRVLATLGGFLGVLLIAKPGVAFQPAMLVALGSALLVSLAMLQVKQLSGTENPDTITFYFMAFGVLLATPLALVQWRMPAPHHWPLLAAMGLASFFGQQFLTRGYTIGTFSKMAPMDFLRLPLSVAIGLAVFAEVPDPWSLIGMAIIAAALLAIVRGGMARPRPLPEPQPAPRA